MSDKFQSILLGGAVVGLVSSFLPVIHPFLGCAGCLLVPIAGFVAVWHYLNNGGEPLQAGPGAGVGALAGIVAAVVSGLVGLLLTQIGLAPDSQEFMRDFMEQMGTDPDQLEGMETQQTPMMMAVGWIFGVGISAILGAVGGAIGASMLGKKE